MTNAKTTIITLFLLTLFGCASSLDIEKFKASIETQEKNGPHTISRCVYIPFKYERQVERPFSHCAYIQNPTGFYLYTRNKETQNYQETHAIPYESIGCAIHYKNGPLKGVIALLTNSQMFYINLLAPSQDTANQQARNQALTGLKDHDIKIYEYESKASSPLLTYEFKLNYFCTKTGKSK